MKDDTFPLIIMLYFSCVSTNIIELRFIYFLNSKNSLESRSS